jgi:hypothetical protein
MALLYIYAGTCLPDRHLIPHLLITNPTPLDFSTLPMAVEAFRAVSDVAFADARMKLTCSHGGRLVPSGSPDAAPRYVGGETRVLAFPRSASFRDLTARLSEMAGGVEVRSVRHRLADDEDVVVSVTCDEELAHMRDVYDRLRATRPAAGFRVFVDTTPASASGIAHQRQRAASGRLPPLAPKLRRVQALAGSTQLHRRPPAYPAPMRRVQSGHELARASGEQPSFDHRSHHYQCRLVSQRRQDVFAPPPPLPCSMPNMSRRNVNTESVEAEAKARS